MKRFLQFVCIALALVSAALAKSTITIGREVFTLADEEHNADGVTRTFLPAHDSFPMWNRLVSVEELNSVDDPQKYIGAYAQQYQAQNPGIKFEMFQNEKNGAWVIDFLAVSDEPGKRFAQWNVVRAHKAKRGVVVYYYASRLYFKESALEVKDAFAKLREDMVPIVYAADFQEKEEPDQAVVAAPSAKPTITIGDDVFTLAQQKETKQGTFREFVLAQESVVTWSRLVAVSEFKLLDDPKQYIVDRAQAYQKQNPGLKFDLFESKATGAWIVDFVTPPPNPETPLVEWNVVRAQRTAHGIVVYSYAARFFFRESVAEVQDALVKLRAKMAPIVYAADFQEKEASNNAAAARAFPSAPAVAVGPTAPAKPTITVGREVFTLAHQEQGKEGALREFVAVQESLERWTRLAAVREFKALDDPKQYIVAMARGYQKQNPGLKFDLFESKATGGWIIDFLSAPDGSESRFVEWNVFRAQRAAQGIVVYQYAARLYFKESAAEIRDALAKLRAEMAPIVYTADFQEK